MAATLPALVYSLCFVTSGACASLLGRTYRRTGANLLLWSAGCFLLLAINNLFVIVDLLILPDVDFTIMRLFLSLGASLVLLFGFIWNSGERQ